MKLTVYPYSLIFKTPFRISHGVRTHTDVVYVKIENNQHVGWGEATLPPYLPETQETVIHFLQAFAAKMESNNLENWFKHTKTLKDNLCAKAALDMALWNLRVGIEGFPIRQLLGIKQSNTPSCTYTIGISSLQDMRQKIEDANQIGFELFKVKLSGEEDETVIQNFRMLTNKPFAVDVNQGWKNAEEAILKIKWLKQAGCLFVEQPLHKDALDEMSFVKQHSELPLYADETCQTFEDLAKVQPVFDGVNIKLMKCGGLTEAHRMVLEAQRLNLKILIGCMSESSVGCSAAAELSSMADFVDLDGPYLIANDPFEGMKIEQGKTVQHPLNLKNESLFTNQEHTV